MVSAKPLKSNTNKSPIMYAPDLDTRLHLVLRLDEEVEHLLGVNRRLTVERHQTDDGSAVDGRLSEKRML